MIEASRVAVASSGVLVNQRGDDSGDAAELAPERLGRHAFDKATPVHGDERDVVAVRHRRDWAHVLDLLANGIHDVLHVSFCVGCVRVHIPKLVDRFGGDAATDRAAQTRK